MEEIIKKEDEVKQEGLEDGDTRTPSEESPESEIVEPNSETVDEGKPEPAQEEGNVGEGTGDALAQEQGQDSQEGLGNAEPPQEKVGEEPPAEKMFTQSQVNEIVGNRVREAKERAMKDLLERYGVNTEDEMNDVFGKGQIYADLYDEFETGQKNLREANSEIALLKSGILPERWGDVKAILGANGLETSFENIAQMLPTHPEWKGAVKGMLNEESLENAAMKGGTGDPTPEPIRLTKLGADPSPKPEMTEQEMAEKLYGMKL